MFWGRSGSGSRQSVHVVRALEQGRGDARSLPRDGRPVDCVGEFLTYSGGAGTSSG